MNTEYCTHTHTHIKLCSELLEHGDINHYCIKINEIILNAELDKILIIKKGLLTIQNLYLSIVRLIRTRFDYFTILTAFFLPSLLS